MPRPLRRSRRPAQPPRPFGAGADPARTQRADGGSTDAIGKVVVFEGDPLAGRVTDVIFELESGEIVAYEVDPGDGTMRFVAAELLTRESPVALHFPADWEEPATDDGEFMALDRLPPKRPS